VRAFIGALPEQAAPRLAEGRLACLTSTRRGPLLEAWYPAGSGLTAARCRVPQLPFSRPSLCFVAAFVPIRRDSPRLALISA
jgi:hypothetical protein